MRKKKGIMFLQALWILSLINSGAAGCPTDCFCNLDPKNRRQVVCNKGGLSGDLPVVDINTQVIKITAPEDKENDLLIGPEFEKYPKLEELHVSYSKIPAIGKHTFWGIKTLKVIDFSNNNLTSIQDYNFRGLVNLVRLDLSCNKLENIASSTFRSMTELKYLSLAGNFLSSFSPRMFHMLTKLQELDLSYNKLEHLDPQVFGDIRGLKVLSCKGCGLRTMNPHVFMIISDLTHLDLSCNQFNFLASESFLSLRKLEVLRLDGNHIPVIVEGTFTSQTKLEVLSISKSRLAKVTTHGLVNLTSLVELDLSYNKLNKLEPQTFSPMNETLRILSVSGNNIHASDFADALRAIPKLKELSMADMGISNTDLLLGSFSPVENLKFLNLSGNEFTQFPFQLLTPVSKLAELDLSRNKFHGLDEKLVAKLEPLKNVHLEGNPWACDLCHISGMLHRLNNSAWIKKVICSLPQNLKGRSLESLLPSKLGWCGKRLEYEEEGFPGLALTHNTQVGLMAAGAAVALLVITMAAIVAGLLYNRHHAAYYYTQEEKRAPEKDAILLKNGISNGDPDIKKVSIATIDEITKDPDLQALTNGS